MAHSTSTKKAAKLAKSGKGKKVRFQGGTVFPLTVAIVLVLGLALVAYARQSRPSVDASAPTVTDHWHHAYGFYLCDTWFKLTGTLEEATSTGFANTDYARTGIHSHDDGLIHWHAFTSAAVGKRATLGVFLKNYGVHLTNELLQFPVEQRAGLPHQQETGLFEEGSTTCTVDGKEVPGELKVIVWNNFTDTDAGTTYIAEFNNIVLGVDQMVVSIAFAPKGTDVGMPPWTADLPSLALNDMAFDRPDDLIGNVNGSAVPIIDSDSIGDVEINEDGSLVPVGDATVPSSTPAVTD